MYSKRSQISWLLLNLRDVKSSEISYKICAKLETLRYAAKVEAFSGGKWTSPVVVRAPCGGGCGDGGQHEQSLWGWLGHIPGLTVIVPSTPADAGGLMLAALRHDGPVIFLEHKLLSESWLELLGSGGRPPKYRI